LVRINFDFGFQSLELYPKLSFNVFNDRIEEQFPLGFNNQILTIKFRVHLDPNRDSILVKFLNPTFFFWCKFPPKGLRKLGPMKGIKAKKGYKS
jgi:hypothetical protein